MVTGGVYKLIIIRSFGRLFLGARLIVFNTFNVTFFSSRGDGALLVPAEIAKFSLKSVKRAATRAWQTTAEPGRRQGRKYIYLRAWH